MRVKCPLSFILLLSISQFLFAGDGIRPERRKYINEHKDDAIRDMQKSGVPASITLAQACLESLDGCSALAKDANNHFGIKCSNWTGPTYIQDDDRKDECFRKYKSTLESYDDHSLFLSTRPRYAFLFQIDKNDYKAWAKGLKKAGYATDPGYADRLIKIIEDNQLFLLDQMKDANYTASNKIEMEDAMPSPSPKRIYVPSVEPVDAIITRTVQSNNGVDYIIARNGDTFHSIAKEFKLGYWQLPKYNEMSSDTQLQDGQIVYLRPKKSEGSEPVYTAKPGDSIITISQATGIKTKYICKYNNLSENASVEPGQQIYLRKHQSKS